MARSVPRHVKFQSAVLSKIDAEVFFHILETELLAFDIDGIPEIKETASRLSPVSTLPPTPQV